MEVSGDIFYCHEGVGKCYRLWWVVARAAKILQCIEHKRMISVNVKGTVAEKL